MHLSFSWPENSRARDSTEGPRRQEATQQAFACVCLVLSPPVRRHRGAGARGAWLRSATDALLSARHARAPPVRNRVISRHVSTQPAFLALEQGVRARVFVARAQASILHFPTFPWIGASLSLSRPIVGTSHTPCAHHHVSFFDLFGRIHQDEAMYTWPSLPPSHVSLRDCSGASIDLFAVVGATG